jgi:hypothetical protein
LDDLNHLFHRQGVASFAADTASSSAARADYRRQAADFSRAIAAFAARPSFASRPPLTV